jgi:PTH2 family peptidyl-tRNA hydrolase
MRKDLNMRKGKMIAQGAHASVGVILDIQRRIEGNSQCREAGYYDVEEIPYLEAFYSWVEGTFTKICVSVDSMAEILLIKVKAEEAGLPVKLIEDSGATEFHGVPTVTCLAIGPAWADEIDKITGGLSLL